MKWLKIIFTVIVFKIVTITVLVVMLANKPVPESITYGASFNTFYATELGLDWKITYDALIDELGVRHLRLAAHWPMVEPEAGQYNFTELDYQIARAEEVGASVVLAIGRRLPRWPECHIPAWAQEINIEERNTAQINYMKKVIERYRESSVVIMWQVENEPFLSVFAFEHCGELDEDFFAQEISLVRELDPSRPILVTDSGNLGTWSGAFRYGDYFGTSVYVHFWNPDLGQFKTLLPPWFYRLKEKIMFLWFGERETYLIELSAEPWLLAPISEVPIDVQFTRMNIDKFEDILSYAEKTRYDKQYLWGVEWWYWLHIQGQSEMWNRGKKLYQ
jgi:hypothetical protein